MGFLKILTQGSKNILYENFCLCIGVPIIENKYDKKPKANSRLNSYLKLSLKDNDSLEIPYFQ